MHRKFKKGDSLTIKQKIKEKNKLIKPFIEKYGKPVIVHSTPDYSSFKKIITGGKLKIPENAENNEHLYIERLLKLYPSIFFSLGFVYAVAYDFKYSLIFDLNLLKEAKYYNKSIGFQCYREVIRYWEKHDPSYVKMLSQRNKTCKEVIDNYYNKEYEGRKRTIFEFWKIEKDLIELINGYPKKRDLIRMFMRIAEERYVLYPKSIKVAKKSYLEESASEIIFKKEMSLLNNRNFLGFYIKGKIPASLKEMLKKRYSDKIFFDGKKIMKVRDL